MNSLEFHEEAEKEFSEAYVWYALQQAGLEERFKEAVQELLDKLKITPQYFGYAKKPFREASVNIFPYTIVFRINNRNNTVYISAIYHTSRNPIKNLERDKIPSPALAQLCSIAL